MNTFCASCGFTSSTIRGGSIECDHTTADLAIYEGSLFGTENISVVNLISFLEKWLLSGTATVTIGREVYPIDSTYCSKSQYVLDCSRQGTTSTPTTVMSSTVTTTGSSLTTGSAANTLVVISQKQGSNVSTAEVGGLVIGAIIIVLFIIFVILLVVLLVRSFFCRNSDMK